MDSDYAQAPLGIEGLNWCSNLIASQTDSSIHLIENIGSGVTEITHYYNADEYSGWFAVHLGQIDKLTFFGDPSKNIRGAFIDCRKNSPTLHKRVDISFTPDPTKHIYIDRGIGHLFYHKTGVTIRVETLLYVSENNPDFNFVNDSINFRGDELIANLPVFQINELPLPSEVSEYILVQQQKSIIEGGFKQIASDIRLQGQTKRITIKI